jgi:phospholipid-binding lipoprotein MlaA
LNKHIGTDSITNNNTQNKTFALFNLIAMILATFLPGNSKPNYKGLTTRLRRNRYSYHYLVVLTSLLLLTSCASTSYDGNVPDPLEPVHRVVFKFNEKVDTYIAEPIAKAYQYTPSPIRTGVSNFFNNTDDVMTVINDILQFKIHQSISDSMRIIVNSSFGVLGLIDVASDWDLPRHNERFADTLGYWGINSGSYLVLPIFGPSSLRDASGLALDFYTYPLAYLHPVRHRNSLQGLKMVSNRADLLAVTDLTQEVAIDPYAFTRDTYYQWRQNQIYDGNPPEQFPQDFNPDNLE